MEVVDGWITSGVFFEADAGDISISSDGFVRISDASLVSTQTGLKGDAGSLLIVAADGLEISDSTVATATSGEGNGGSVRIAAGTHAEIVDSLVSSSTSGEGNGDAGDIVISGDRVVNLVGGSVQSETRSAGSAGNILVEAPRVYLCGTSCTGELKLSSASHGTGNAGNITIKAPRDAPSSFRADGFLIVTSLSSGSGRVGNIDIEDFDDVEVRSSLFNGISFGPDTEPGTIRFLGIGRMRGEFLQVGAENHAPNSQGTANITIEAQTLELVDSDLTAGVRGGGGKAKSSGGRVTLDVSGSLEMDRTRISTETETGGRAGDIAIHAGSFGASRGSRVNSSSDDTGRAGNVTVKADGAVRVSGGSSITTDAPKSDGGNIRVMAGRLVHLSDGEISASVGGGQGGRIEIDPVLVLLEDSTITAKAAEEGGRGGRIVITADVVLATVGGEAVPPESVLDASAPGGLELSGTVEVNAPDTDLASQITKLPESYFDASSMIQPHCAARGGTSGSLTMAGGGIPASPDGFLSASLSQPAGQQEPRSVVLGQAVEAQPITSVGGYGG